MTVEKIVERIASDVDGSVQVKLIQDFLRRRGRKGLTFYFQVSNERNAKGDLPDKESVACMQERNPL